MALARMVKREILIELEEDRYREIERWKIKRKVPDRQKQIDKERQIKRFLSRKFGKILSNFINQQLS